MTKYLLRFAARVAIIAAIVFVITIGAEWAVANVWPAIIFAVLLWAAFIVVVLRFGHARAQQRFSEGAHAAERVTKTDA